MPFALYVEWVFDSQVVEVGRARLSEALRHAEAASTRPGVKFTAVTNDVRHTLAAFVDGEGVSLLSPAEEAAVKAKKCRQSPKGCPGDVGPMGYCEHHFFDLTIYGDPGNTTVRPPESLNAVGALSDRLKRPRTLTDADMAHGYERIHAEGATAKDLATDFGRQTETVYRHFPMLRKPTTYRGHRVGPGDLADIERLRKEDPDITASAVAKRLGFSVTTITKHAPDLADGRRRLNKEEIAEIGVVLRTNLSITLERVAAMYGVQPATIRRHYPDADGRRLAGHEKSRVRQMIRDGESEERIAGEFGIPIRAVRATFERELRAAGGASSDESGGKSPRPRALHPPKIVKAVSDDFPAPPVGGAPAGSSSAATSNPPNTQDQRRGRGR